MKKVLLLGTLLRLMILPLGVVGFVFAETGYPPISFSRLGLNGMETMRPNGSFLVEVRVGNRWESAGSLPFDRFYREQRLELKQAWFQKGVPAIRLSKQGGGAAHIDTVLLNGHPPNYCQNGNASTLHKLAARDSDVWDASNRQIQLAFSSMDERPLLTVIARIESLRISDHAFFFPTENRYRKLDNVDSFYSYSLKLSRKTTPSGNPLLQMQNRPAFFKEYSHTGSGHPSGYTYGWVSHDDRYLYAAIDFTADNTCDGNKDYAALLVRTTNGIKQFRITEKETRWGDAHFTYTPRAAYQHKVYTFKIPRRELTTSTSNPADLRLAFAAYGTATQGNIHPSVAYDSNRNRFLLVYQKITSATVSIDIYGRFLDASGSPLGDEFIISNSVNDQVDPVVGFDSANNMYLVVWADYGTGSHWDIIGRRIHANGVPDGAQFIISAGVKDRSSPAITVDTINHRFLVVWEDLRNSSRDIYGRILNPVTGFFTADFAVCNDTNTQFFPAAAFEPNQQTYLIAWEDNRNSGTSGWDIYGQWLQSNGSLAGVNQVISTATDDQRRVAVCAESGYQKFLVVWYDQRSGTDTDIFRQSVNSDSTGTFLSGTFTNVTPGAASNQLDPAVAYDRSLGRDFLTWVDMRTGGWDIYGQRIDTYTDTPLAPPFFSIADTSNALYSPAIANNSNCGNFLVVFEDHGGSWDDIGIALVGRACPRLNLPLIQKN